MRIAPALLAGTGVSFVLYGVCLYSEALTLSTRHLNTTEILTGYAVLEVGAVAVLYGQFAWLANVALCASWAYALGNKPDPVLYTSAVALLLSLHTLQFNQSQITDKSGSCCLQIDHLHIGFYFWLASISAMVAASFVAKHSGNRPNPSINTDAAR